MNKKTISPNPQQPVERITSGQLPSQLAELAEAALTSGGIGTGVLSSGISKGEFCYCSYSEDDAE